LEAEVFPFWEFSCVTTTVVWMVLSSFLPSSNSSYSKVRPSERFLWLSYLCISVFTLFLYFDFLGGSLLALASISVCFFSWNLSLHERDLLRRNSEGCWVGENYIYIYIFTVLEFELKAYTLSHSTSPHFLVMGFFEVGSCELFAQASFKPWSSCQWLYLFFLLRVL
jgi:hypothetical protein